MATKNLQPLQANYDPRWFIWTIVFLVVSGISLVSYIVLSDNSANNPIPLAIARTSLHKTLKK
jgi:hypothetical protein